MRNDQVIGLCFFVIAALFIADGVWGGSIHWLRLSMGVGFALIGVLLLARDRRRVPPAA